MHHTLKPPVIESDAGPQPMDLRWFKGDRLLATFNWAHRETPPPADDWQRVDFDDAAWLRGPARMSCRTAFLSRLCMRGAFSVTDPTRISGLRLSVGYRGGLIAYLNGREVARRHLPDGATGRDMFADPYEPEAFTPPGGWEGKAPRDFQGETEQQAALRQREANIQVDADLLRPGVNVLALEIVRAPYGRVLEEKKGARGMRYFPYYPAFNTCQIDQVQLTAEEAHGLAPNAVRQPGFQVWNSGMLQADYDLDFGGPEPLRPIRMTGARNGTFSGKVVVGCDEAIGNLRAKASDLASKHAVIPASAVRIRYGFPWGGEAGVNGQRTIYRRRVPEFNCYPRVPTMLGGLAAQPPAEVPVREVPSGSDDLNTPGRPEPVFGAVAPVWVTVRVPKDVPAGRYEGRIAIRADGWEPVDVPVELTVTDYTLPDAEEYRTLLELVQSPDTLALEYKVDLWSEKHFELIGKTMDLMRQVGVQVVYVPLICETNLGNAESMVRWVETPEGAYSFDFSVMERYLDLATQRIGRPRVVCFVVWDIYMGQGGGYKDTWSHNRALVSERMKYAGKGPMVTVLDPESGSTETQHVAPYSDPASKEHWTRLFEELHSRMRERGLEETMMIGLMSDDWPTREEDEFYAEVSRGLPWVSHSHVPVTRGAERPEDGIVTTVATSQGNAQVNRVGLRVGYHSAVLSCTFANNDPPLGTHLGWKRRDLACYQPRYESFQPASRWRNLMELNITGAQRGVARGGADFWPAVKDSRGRRRGTVDDLYPHSAWRNLDIPWCVLAPGPTGPASTHHFEAMREGIQECQARIAIEAALTDEASRQKLPAELVGRCEELLVERTHFMLKAISHLQINNEWGNLTGPSPICRQIGVTGHRWFAGSGWQERSERLYALAGEVEKAMDSPTDGR